MRGSIVIAYNLVLLRYCGRERSAPAPASNVEWDFERARKRERETARKRESAAPSVALSTCLFSARPRGSGTSTATCRFEPQAHATRLPLHALAQLPAPSSSAFGPSTGDDGLASSRALQVCGPPFHFPLSTFHTPPHHPPLLLLPPFSPRRQDREAWSRCSNSISSPPPSSRPSFLLSLTTHCQFLHTHSSALLHSCIRCRHRRLG